jgi:hypothetical protein
LRPLYYCGTVLGPLEILPSVGVSPTKLISKCSATLGAQRRVGTHAAMVTKGSTGAPRKFRGAPKIAANFFSAPHHRGAEVSFFGYGRGQRRTESLGRGRPDSPAKLQSPAALRKPLPSLFGLCGGWGSMGRLGRLAARSARATRARWHKARNMSWPRVRWLHSCALPRGPWARTARTSPPSLIECEEWC